MSDSYPATIRIKQKIDLGTLHVRTPNQCGQLEIIKQEMNSFNVINLDVCEIRGAKDEERISE